MICYLRSITYGEPRVQFWSGVDEDLLCFDLRCGALRIMNATAAIPAAIPAATRMYVKVLIDVSEVGADTV